MIPEHHGNLAQLVGVLHVCGDDPTFKNDGAKEFECSPRMWR